MQESLPTVEVLTSADGALEKDMLCSRCGYNLRGLKLEGLCPECGSPVSRSVYGNLLRYAEPDWINKLRKGIAVKLWGMLIGLGIGVIAGISAVVGMPPVMISIASLVGGLFGLWAIFLITTPEPMIGVDEDPVSLRTIIRATASLGFLGGQFQQASQGGATFIGAASINASFIWIGMLLNLIGFVAMFGEFIYLRRFAKRIPDEALASSTKTVMWGFGISMIVGVLFAIVTVITGLPITGGGIFGGGGAAVGGAAGVGAPAMAGPNYIFIGAACFGGICMLVFGIWYIILLFRYHRVFKTARDEAIQLAEIVQVESTTPADG